MHLAFTDDALSEKGFREQASQLGIRLDHPEQLKFLTSIESLDLQAAPGSGKTTLLALKLSVMSEHWTSDEQGMCVLSHTNTAKDQIIDRLKQSQRARKLLRYPHFIGTIQSFVDTFLAIPYLRAQGIKIRSIDDALYAEAARRELQRNYTFATLRSYLQRQQNGIQMAEKAVYHFQDGDILVPDSARPNVAKTTKVGMQFDQLKALLASRGIFRYEDMYAFAHQHLFRNTWLSTATAHRFPFLLLDEMQDTSELQEVLLDHLFAPQSTVVQRVGDLNQRIFAGKFGSFPRPQEIDLPFSQRFGPAIATVATSLTTQRTQKIIGNGQDGITALLVFDAESILRVVPAFEALAQAVVPPQLLAANPVRVLGARKVPGTSSSFPQSVQCYLPDFADDALATGPPTLITAARTAAQRWAAGNATDGASALWDGVCRGLHLVGFEIDGQRPSKTNLINWLDEHALLDERLRRFFLKVMGTRTISEEVWRMLIGQYVDLLISIAGQLKSPDVLSAFIQHSPSSIAPTGQVADRLTGARASSIHVAKGETHSATLLLECLERSGRKHDLKEVLALLATDSTVTPKTLKTIRDAAQLIFVGVTRPTYLLAVAVMREHVSAHLDKLEAKGWKILDVTGPV